MHTPLLALPQPDVRMPPALAHVWALQSAHCAAFSASEKRPTAQGSHSVPLMNVPGLHVPQYPTEAPPQPLRCEPLGHATLLQVMQCVWPDLFWYSVLPSHAVLVAPSHLFPTGHEVQVRSTDDVPANEGYSVALQVLKAVHVSALALALNTVVPSHAVHSYRTE